MMKKTQRNRKPKWLDDKNNQRDWNNRFKCILNATYANSDPAIFAITSNDRLVAQCATKIRCYVDKDITALLYRMRRERGIAHKKKLENAITGMRAAVELFTERGNNAMAVFVEKLAIGFSGELDRAHLAFQTKRHGRDHAHSSLWECRFYLEAVLNRKLTYATLASLVDAGHDADNKALKDPTTEEQLRKNLSAFARNNPEWMKLLHDRFRMIRTHGTAPETK
jgi:hypothetical protein